MLTGGKNLIDKRKNKLYNYIIVARIHVRTILDLLLLMLYH
jgi:hypothetical protein